MAWYYVKTGGSDLLDGKSISAAWETLSKVNGTTFVAGDKIFFHCGDTFRGSISQTENGTALNRITYTSYDTGAKPKILGSKDLSATSDWEVHSGNVWKTKVTLGTNQNDISNIILNNEESCAFKRNSLAGCDGQSKFFYNTVDHLLYMYSVSNPATFYTHLEAAGHHDVAQGLFHFINSSYITVSGIDVRYSSAAGIEVRDSNNIIIEYCSVSWIGGEWFDSVTKVRLGNGISMVNNVSNIIVRYNYVNQCFDAGISPQGWGAYTQTDINQYGNIITNCWYSYEGYGVATGNSMIRVNFYNNTCINPATCWSNTIDQRPDLSNSRHVMIWTEDGTVTDCYIRNNIFSGTCQTAIRIDLDETYALKHHFDNNLYNVTTLAITHRGTLTSLANWQATESQDPNGVSGDPLFISTSDFHLQAGSPAINAGVDVDLDIDYEGKLVGNPPEIGAYEYEVPVDPFDVELKSFEGLFQKYELQFWDLARCAWCIQFFVPSYVGTIEVLKGSGNPLIFDFQNTDDSIIDPYRPSQVKIEIKVDKNWKFEDLFGPDIMSCFVKIYQGIDSDGDLFFQGWIDPSQYEEPYEAPPYYLTITAVDGLQYLQDIMFAELENSDGTYEYYTERASDAQIIYDILGKIESIEFNEFVNLYAINMNMGSVYSPLDQVLIERSRFYDMSCAETLIAILKKYGAVIRQWDGVFQIYRPVELTKNIVYGRHFTSPSATEPISLSPIQYIHRTATHQESALLQIPGGVQMQINPAKKININQEYGSRDSWVRNFTLHKDTYDAILKTFDEWTVDSQTGLTAIPVSNILPREEEGVALRRYVTIQQSFGQYAKQCGDDEMFRISFDYGFYNKVATPQDGAFASLTLMQLTLGGVLFPIGKYLIKNSDDTEAHWEKIEYNVINSIPTPPIDGIGYGWAGWNTAEYTFKSLPYSAGLSISLGNQYSDNVYVCFKNVRFISSSAELSKITYQRTFWERLYYDRGANRYWLRNIRMKSRYTLKDKYKETDLIVENTYNPITNVTHGNVLDFDFMLGDIVKLSTPSNKGDTGISNNIEQFAGSLAVNAYEAIASVIQSFISDNATAWLAVDVVLDYDENSAGISMLMFKAKIPGIDFAGTAAAISGAVGDVAGDDYTLIANQAGARQLVEYTITGTSGYVTITIAGVPYNMNFFAENLSETIQHFVDLYAANVAILGITLDINSSWDALLILGNDSGDSFTHSVSNHGLTATLSYSINASAIGRRTDVIEITGTNGGATISCCGVSKTLSFGYKVTTPSSEWCAGDDSSDAFPYKPLLQIIGDELATQYSRTKYLIQMPIIERIIGVPSGLNLIGCLVDTGNKKDGVSRKFVVNRGSFNARHRAWDLDLMELLPYDGVQPEIEPEPLPSYDSDEGPVPSSEDPIPVSSEDYEIQMNHIDTIADARFGSTMAVSFEYTSSVARTENIKYYFSSDAAGHLATTSVQTVSVAFSSGTNTKTLTGISYPIYTSKYLQISLEDSPIEHITSNEFDSVQITLNSITSIGTQEVSTAMDPQPTFNSTVLGGSAVVIMYWTIRNSSNSVVASGNNTFTFSTGTSNKQFAGVNCPAAEYDDCTFQIGYNIGNTVITSNTYSIVHP